jgi:hypothetical protein
MFSVRLREYEVDVDRSTSRGPEVERIYFVIIEMARKSYSSTLSSISHIHYEDVGCIPYYYYFFWVSILQTILTNKLLYFQLFVEAKKKKNKKKQETLY